MVNNTAIGLMNNNGGVKNKSVATDQNSTQTCAFQLQHKSSSDGVFVWTKNIQGKQTDMKIQPLKKKTMRVGFYFNPKNDFHYKNKRFFIGFLLLWLYSNSSNI